MSIYSGFATRHQEQSYDQCLDSVLYILQKRLIKFYKHESADEDKFISILAKLHNQMKNMETHKYLQPKSSSTFDQLISILKIKQAQQASMNVVYHRDSCIQSQIASDTHPAKRKNEIIYKAPNKNQDISDKSPQVKNPPRANKIRAQTAVNKIHHKNSLHNGKRNAELEDLVSKYQSSAQVRNRNNSFDRKVLNKDKSYDKGDVKRKNGLSSRSKRQTITSVRQDEKAVNNWGDDGKQTDSADVRQLIRGYISRTKKSYLRDYNKKKQEIDVIFKNKV